MAQSQILFYKHGQCMLPDTCTKYEQHHHNSSLGYHNKHSKVMKNDHNYSNLAQSQILFYMHQLSIVSNHGTQYVKNPASHHRGMHDLRIAWWTDWRTAR